MDHFFYKTIQLANQFHGNMINSQILIKNIFGDEMKYILLGMKWTLIDFTPKSQNNFWRKIYIVK